MMTRMFRFLCFINFLCDTLTSESEGKLGEAAVALLMDPLLLSHRATHQFIPEEKKPSYSHRRPQTPGPNVPRLSPVKLVETKSERKTSRSRVMSLIENPALKKTTESSGRLKPISPRNELTPRKSEPVSPIIVDPFYKEIEDAIMSLDSETLSGIAARPEMKSLPKEKLLDLLDFAHLRSRLSKTTAEFYRDFFIEIVSKIAPENFSESYKDFIMATVQKRAPRHLLEAACKNINLLSMEELNELIHEIENKLIWRSIDRTGKPQMEIFNEMIMMIAINLGNCEHIFDLDHVRDMFAIKTRVSDTYLITKSRNRLKFIYMSVIMVAGLKTANSKIMDDEFMITLVPFFEMGRQDFNLSSRKILGFINQIWKVVLPSIKPEQTEALGRFMKMLHEVIKNQSDLTYVPINMVGLEDLHFYIECDLLYLAKARLRLYRLSKIKKSQLISLLNSAEMLNNDNASELIIDLIGAVNISPQFINESDLKALFVRPRMLLQGTFTIPKRYSREICTSNAELKQSKNIIWDLPADLFVEKEPTDLSEIYLLMETLSDLPRLFLFMVFGIPINNFTKVTLGMNELPEVRELVDIVNFFLERWCGINSNTGTYPIFKVLSSDEDKSV